MPVTATNLSQKQTQSGPVWSSPSMTAPPLRCSVGNTLCTSRSVLELTGSGESPTGPPGKIMDVRNWFAAEEGAAGYTGWQDIKCRITETKGGEEGWKRDKVEEQEEAVVLHVCVCDGGGRVLEKLHSEVLERAINTNLLPARWATSSQVGVVSIAVNAIYLMYWPIMTSPLCVPAEGSPAVSQQGHRRTIDWGVALFLQPDPHSCFCLLLFLYPNPPSICLFFPPPPRSICLPLPLPLYLLPCLPLSLRLFLSLSLHSLRTGYRRIFRPLLQKSIISF